MAAPKLGLLSDKCWIHIHGVQDFWGNTPLHLLMASAEILQEVGAEDVRHRLAEVVLFMLQHGAHLEARNTAGKTPPELGPAFAKGAWERAKHALDSQTDLEPQESSMNSSNLDEPGTTNHVNVHDTSGAVPTQSSPSYQQGVPESHAETVDASTQKRQSASGICGTCSPCTTDTHDASENMLAELPSHGQHSLDAVGDLHLQGDLVVGTDSRCLEGGEATRAVPLCEQTQSNAAEAGALNRCEVAADMEGAHYLQVGQDREAGTLAPSHVAKPEETAVEDLAAEGLTDGAGRVVEEAPPEEQPLLESN
jgi:hypothetical protein